MTVTAVITTHDNPGGMQGMIDQLLEQQYVPDEIIVLASDTVAQPRFGRYKNCSAQLNLLNLNDWGHQKRATGLTLATSDYVGFFNDDDKYSSKYLAKLLAEAEKTGADIVACDFVSHLCGPEPMITFPKLGHITSGNFIVRTSLAQRVGYNHRMYEADGRFIEDLIAAGSTFARVPEVLYVHQ